MRRVRGSRGREYALITGVAWTIEAAGIVWDALKSGHAQMDREFLRECRVLEQFPEAMDPRHMDPERLPWSACLNTTDGLCGIAPDEYLWMADFVCCATLAILDEYAPAEMPR